VASDSVYAIAQFVAENRVSDGLKKLNVRRVARKSKAGYRWGTFRGMTLNRNVENTIKEPIVMENSVSSLTGRPMAFERQVNRLRTCGGRMPLVSNAAGKWLSHERSRSIGAPHCDGLPY
jgi:hypothetical protein